MRPLTEEPSSTRLGGRRPVAAVRSLSLRCFPRMWRKIVQLLAIPVVASALALPAGARLRFGIDPQPAGTAGAIQSPVVAVDQTKTSAHRAAGDHHDRGARRRPPRRDRPALVQPARQRAGRDGLRRAIRPADGRLPPQAGVRHVPCADRALRGTSRPTRQRAAAPTTSRAPRSDTGANRTDIVSRRRCRGQQLIST